MTVLFWSTVSFLGAAIVVLFASLMWWVEALQGIRDEHNHEIQRLKSALRDLKGAFECHTNDNKKDMKPLRKAVDKLVARCETLEGFQREFLRGLQEKLQTMPEEPQKEFIVSWIVDVAAEDPEAAARQARELQLDPSALVGNFHVEEPDTNTRWEVDLDERCTAGPYAGPSSE